MKKILYVPQGFGAKLLRIESKRYGISGLFTDNFSSCNILIVSSKNVLKLMHIDTNVLNNDKMFQQVISEINSVVEKPRHVLVAFRNVETGGGRNVNLFLEFKLELEIPLQEITEIEIDDFTQGFAVEFSDETAAHYPKIQTFPTRPGGLLHHPQEQILVTIQKMEQVIGQAARKMSQLSKAKRLCLFDSGWHVLGDNELKLDISHPLTKLEIGLFQACDSYLDIVRLLKEFILQSNVLYELPDLNYILAFLAPHFEDFLKGYNHEPIYKRNIKLLMTLDRCHSHSNTDLEFKEQILNLIENKHEGVFEQVEKILDDYKSEKKMTDYKEIVLDGFETYKSHFQSRKYYSDYRKEIAEQKQEAERLHVQAMTAYKMKAYSQAEELFLSVLRICMHYSTKSESCFSTAFFNYGQTMAKQNRHKEAIEFLSTALKWRENEVIPRPSQENLERTRNALENCKNKFLV